MSVILKTLADFRRYLAIPNARIQLIRFDREVFRDAPARWVVRTVRKLQTNAVQFETGESGGSWLHWDGKPGSHPSAAFRFRDDVVTVDLGKSGAFAEVFQYRCWIAETDAPRFPQAPCPEWSPWGRPDDRTELSAGVWLVETPSHGGIYLSSERNAAVPDYLRDAGGWYEEDCDWAIAALVHPEAFKREQVLAADKCLRHWQPDEYEKLTGNSICPGESRVRDVAVWHRAHPNALLARSAFNDHVTWVPTGKVGVIARSTMDGAPWHPVGIDRYFLVDAAEYSPTATVAGFVIEPSRHLEVDCPANLHARTAA
jgi:hypothetical protein